jgi:hypothetical protein
MRLIVTSIMLAALLIMMALCLGMALGPEVP